MKIGGFDVTRHIGEDTDIWKRLRQAGKVKIIGGISVKTSARRLGSSLPRLIKYLRDHLRVFFQTKKFSTPLENVRQKVYSVYDSINDLPLSSFIIIICLASIIFLIGYMPKVNLWSISSIKTRDKVIALTFDDGPNEPYTSQILKILKEHQVPATFFLLGENAQKYPNIVKEIDSEGHLIGNHTTNHKRFLMLKTPTAITQDIDTTNEIIGKLIGKRPKFFRPPYGFRSFWGARILSIKGYQIVTWNDMTSDWAKVSSEKITIDIIRRAKPGTIIDLHDGSEDPKNADRSTTVKAVGEIIDLLQSEGYKFVRLDELLKKPAYF